MKLLKILQSIRLLIIIQGNSNPNGAVVRVLTKLGYPANSIRKAIVVLNDMTLADIANGETSIQNISNTLNGKRQSATAKALIAASLELKPGELFTQDAKHG